MRTASVIFLSYCLGYLQGFITPYSKLYGKIIFTSERFDENRSWGLKMTQEVENNQPKGNVETVEPAKDEPPYKGSLSPTGLKFMQCSACKTSYVLKEEEMVGKKGAKVRCGVCSKEWFQTFDRLLETDEITRLAPMTDEQKAHTERIIRDQNMPRYPRIDKIGIFIGNVPYSFSDEEFASLFAEYGLTNAVLVKDPEGASKGYGFLEVKFLFPQDIRSLLFFDI
jgi:predicted Zn finger-like uncharacterized protein